MENNKGLIKKYIISKANGSTVSEDAEYFVLRLDEKQKDDVHRNACVKAVLTYADEIENHLPELAKDLRAKYSDK